jgi:ABC-type nitrate/sulfonate/bicarbonate transport system permease component
MNRRHAAAWLKQGGPPLLAVVLFALAWELAADLLHIEQWILPSPSAILQEGAASFPRIWMHTLATLKLTVIGFAAGVLCGMAISVALHGIPGLKNALYPLLIVSQNIHPAALGPLLMIWFGFGVLPKVIVVGLVCFFPVAVAMMDGLAHPDRTMLNYMRMIGASRWDVLFKLEMPNSLPYLFSGLKIAAVYSVMGAVICEWLGADKGIGVFIQLSRNSFNTTRVFDAIMVIIALSLLLFAVVAVAERLFVRWNPRK